MALKLNYMGEQKTEPVVIDYPTPVYTLSEKKEFQPAFGISKLLGNFLQRLRDVAKSLIKKIHVSEIDRWKARVPGIDWGAKPTPITSDLNVDNAPLPLSNEKHCASEYTKTYTTFSGCDTVVSFNGKVMGALQSFEYEVDGQMKGEAKLTCTQFEKNCLQADDTLAVVTMANEYGRAAFQVFRLNKLKRYYTGATMDNICSNEQAIYDCEILIPQSPVPEAVRLMPEETFNDMVKNVYAKCTKKNYLPGTQKIVGNIANRMYFYYLYKNFC